MQCDAEALKEQIQEKKRREEHERQLDEAYAREASRQAMLYNELNQRIENVIGDLIFLNYSL